MTMKVLQCCVSEAGGGAARAAYRLHRGLMSLGVDSRLLVQKKRSEDPMVIGSQTFAEKYLSRVRPHLDLIPLRWYPHRHNSLFSPAWPSINLASKVSSVNADLIHLHWVDAGFLSIKAIGQIKKPVVWTLHDSWAFTGGCHVPYDCIRYRDSCGTCPNLGSERPRDLSHWVWSRKRKAWKGLNLTVVTPSRWLAECARSSSLFHDMRIEVIPNGLDTSTFKLVEQEKARKALGLPLDKKIMLFGAVGAASDSNKGINLLLPALQSLASNGWKNRLELVIFGSDAPIQGLNFDIPTRFLGYIRDDYILKQVYSAADVMVVPSLQESFCQTASEALACSVPVVAFGTTGLLDVVDHKLNGYLAKPFDTEDLAKGIAWVLQDEVQWRELSSQARQKTESEFALNRVAERYLQLYQNILRKSG